MVCYKSRLQLHKAIECATEVVGQAERRSFHALVQDVHALSISGSNYSIAPSQGFVQFGRQGMTVMPERQNDILVLDVANTPLVALQYAILVSEKTLGVSNMQSLHTVRREQYTMAREQLGVHPHEFLFAHFLARLQPVLAHFSEKNVQLIQRKQQVYGMLRDRYCTRKYQLTTKTRVVNIFGEDHPWIAQRMRDCA